MTTSTKDTTGNSGWAAQAKSFADQRASLSYRYGELKMYLNYPWMYRHELAALNKQYDALEAEEAAARKAWTEAENEES